MAVHGLVQADMGDFFGSVETLGDATVAIGMVGELGAGANALGAVGSESRTTGLGVGGDRTFAAEVRSGMGEDVRPATIVREIQHGERVADIVREVDSLTKTGNEHAVASLVDGRRVIVSGGPDGIDFRELDLRRLLLHSHPPGSVPGYSPEDVELIDYLFQRSSWLLEVGEDSSKLNRFRVGSK